MNIGNIKIYPEAAQALIKQAYFAASNGFVPATSGNFSVRNDLDTIAITISGRDKAKLSEVDLMLVDINGLPLDNTLKPSAETLLHTQLYMDYPEVTAISHYHSTLSSVLSKVLFKQGINQIKIESYELLKAIRGYTTHNAHLIIPIFKNTQNIPDLVAQVSQYILTKPEEEAFWAYMIEGHGIYIWGHSVDETIRHADAINNLLLSYKLELELN